MITTRQHGYLQVFLQTLCPPEMMDKLLNRLEAMGVTPGYEVKGHDLREYELLYENARLVIQYDTFVGICLYPDAMEDVTAAEEEKMLRLAAILMEDIP